MLHAHYKSHCLSRASEGGYSVIYSGIMTNGREKCGSPFPFGGIMLPAGVRSVPCPVTVRSSCQSARTQGKSLVKDQKGEPHMEAGATWRCGLNIYICLEMYQPQLILASTKPILLSLPFLHKEI